MKAPEKDYTNKCGSCIYFEYLEIDGQVFRRGHCNNAKRKTYHDACQKACMRYQKGDNNDES